jgi:hypothetical protein
MDLNLQEQLQSFNTEGVQLLPDGAYTLEVVKATEGKGQKGGFINVIFKAIGGPEAGKQTKMNISFTEASSNIFFQQVYSLGLTEDDIKRCPGLAEVAQLLVGRIVENGAVTQSEWNGRLKQEFGIGQFRLVSVASTGAPAGVPAAAAAAPPTAAPAPPAAPPAALPAAPPAQPPVPPAAPPAAPPADAAPPAAPPAAAPAVTAAAPPAPPAAAPPAAAPDGTPAPTF